VKYYCPIAKADVKLNGDKDHHYGGCKGGEIVVNGNKRICIFWRGRCDLIPSSYSGPTSRDFDNLSRKLIGR